jgi:hypothetical protein
MSSFKIKIVKGVWTHKVKKGLAKPEVAIFEKEVELPFPPFLGLEISTEELHCRTIRRIEWLADQELFRCSITDEHPHLDVDGRDVSFEDLVKTNLNEGWKRVSGNAPE